MISYFTLNTTEKDLPYILFYDNGTEPVSGHWHKEMEIIYCKSGETEMTINNRKYHLKAGDIGVALGGDIHSYSASKNHRRTVIIMDLNMLDNDSVNTDGHTLRHHISQMARASTAWDDADRRKAAEIIDRLEELNECSEYGRTLDVWARLCDLLLLFCKKIPKNPENSRNFTNFSQVKMLEGLENVFKYIEFHYREKITLEDAAKIMNFNPSYFARSFHKITGTTFLLYLNTYRINKARQMLVSTNTNVEQIASECGFGSVKSFNRVFRQIIGTSPTDYRKNTSGKESDEDIA